AGRARVMSGVGAGTAAGLLFGTVLGSVLWTQLGTNAFPLLALLFFLSTALMAGAPGVAAATTKPLPLGEAARSAGEGGPPYAQSRSHLNPGFPPPARRPVGAGILPSLRQVLRAPGLLRLLVAWMLLNAVVGLWLTHAVYQLDAAVSDTGQFLVGRFHGSTLDVLLGAWMLLFIVGSLAWAPLLPRVGEWRAMRIALSGMLLVCASLVVINAGPLPVEARWAALVPFCIGVLLEAGFAPAALAQLAAGSQQSHRGLTMALYSVAFGSGSLLGNWAGAPFVAAGAMNGIIVATAIMASLALATLSLGYRPGGAACVDGHEHGETRAAVIAA
ncbi:MAG TPA: MFS transporter, partial [Chloroflexota bacterium]|nr:MFS transporter [Chloroflexota bacterium]